LNAGGYAGAAAGERSFTRDAVILIFSRRLIPVRSVVDIATRVN